MVDQSDLNNSDKRTLERLNEEYVAAFMSADVDWYERHLADDFVCIESDGSLLDKAQFLSKTAKGPDVANYKLQKVDVQFCGDVGLVRATGLFTRQDGSSGVSRYTDVYTKTGEDWKAVSAQITRTSAPDGESQS
jgi:ketosteroid isomerase-like protein